MAQEAHRRHTATVSSKTHDGYAASASIVSASLLRNSNLVIPSSFVIPISSRSPLLVPSKPLGYDSSLAQLCLEANWEQLTVGQSYISLRGVEVHNLKSVDLDIPHRKLVVFCGLSGSGKTQPGARHALRRRAAALHRNFFGLHAAVLATPGTAGGGKNHRPSARGGGDAQKRPAVPAARTVGTATETNDYLRLLFAKIGQVVCQTCGHEVRRESPQTAAEALVAASGGTRFMVTFRRQPTPSAKPPRESHCRRSCRLRDSFGQ